MSRKTDAEDLAAAKTAGCRLERSRLSEDQVITYITDCVEQFREWGLTVSDGIRIAERLHYHLLFHTLTSVDDNPTALQQNKVIAIRRLLTMVADLRDYPTSNPTASPNVPPTGPSKGVH